VGARIPASVPRGIRRRGQGGVQSRPGPLRSEDRGLTAPRPRRSHSAHPVPPPSRPPPPPHSRPVVRNAPRAPGGSRWPHVYLPPPLPAAGIIAPAMNEPSRIKWRVPPRCRYRRPGTFPVLVSAPIRANPAEAGDAKPRVRRCAGRVERRAVRRPRGAGAADGAADMTAHGDGRVAEGWSAAACEPPGRPVAFWSSPRRPRRFRERAVVATGSPAVASYQLRGGPPGMEGDG